MASTNRVFIYDGKLFLNRGDLQKYAGTSWAGTTNLIKDSSVCQTKFIKQYEANKIYGDKNADGSVDLKYDDDGNPYVVANTLLQQNVNVSLSLGATREESASMRAAELYFAPAEVSDNGGGDVGGDDGGTVVEAPSGEDTSLSLEELLTIKTTQLYEQNVTAAEQMYVEMLNLVELRKIGAINIDIAEANQELARKQAAVTGKQLILENREKTGTYKTAMAAAGISSGSAAAIMKRNKAVADVNAKTAIESGNIEAANYGRDIKTHEASMANMLQQIAMYNNAIGRLHLTYRQDTTGELLSLNEANIHESDNYYDSLGSLEKLNTAIETTNTIIGWFRG